MYSKIQVVTHNYQRLSCSQYSLLVQFQAQQKVSKCPHMKNDSIFTHRGLSKAGNGDECKGISTYATPW
ncbi:hypothetical protein H5410_036374, partial [Solanum commersonii]